MGKKACPTGDFPCANARCLVTGRDKVNQRCAGCGAVWYCGRRCQKRHWSSNGGNHRAYCKPPKPEEAAASSRASPAVVAAGRDDGGNEPAHPCPICLVNEDDHGACGQCFECGRQYCGECNAPQIVGRLSNCPICRAPVAVPDEVAIKRLLRLVARSPGRHTSAAQSNLGGMYAEGKGVPRDFITAMRLYRLAANQGHADGQTNLGRMYAKGEAVPQDFTKAARWYRHAAAQGDAGGQYLLGKLYEDGKGVPQDLTEAVRLYRLAADQRNARGQCLLGWMYEDGTGVPRDFAEAVRLYGLAAAQGDPGGQCNLGLVYYTGTGVPQDLTEAARLFKLAYNQGHRPAVGLLRMIAAQYPAGTRVRIAGLTTNAHLNGRLGTVKSTTPLTAGRIAVRIDGQTKNVSLSWANVGRVGATPR